MDEFQNKNFKTGDDPEISFPGIEFACDVKK